MKQILIKTKCCIKCKLESCDIFTKEQKPKDNDEEFFIPLFKNGKALHPANIRHPDCELNTKQYLITKA